MVIAKKTRSSRQKKVVSTTPVERTKKRRPGQTRPEKTMATKEEGVTVARTRPETRQATRPCATAPCVVHAQNRAWTNSGTLDYNKPWHVLCKAAYPQRVQRIDWSMPSTKPKR